MTRKPDVSLSVYHYIESCVVGKAIFGGEVIESRSIITACAAPCCTDPDIPLSVLVDAVYIISWQAISISEFGEIIAIISAEPIRCADPNAAIPILMYAVYIFVPKTVKSSGLSAFVSKQSVAGSDPNAPIHVLANAVDIPTTYMDEIREPASIITAKPNNSSFQKIG